MVCDYLEIESVQQLGFPPAALIVTLILERLWFLRQQPTQRAVVLWLVAVWLMFLITMTFSSLGCPRPDSSLHGLMMKTARCVIVGMWAAALASVDFLLCETWALWKRRLKAGNSFSQSIARIR